MNSLMSVGHLKKLCQFVKNCIGLTTLVQILENIQLVMIVFRGIYRVICPGFRNYFTTHNCLESYTLYYSSKFGSIIIRSIIAVIWAHITAEIRAQNYAGNMCT